MTSTSLLMGFETREGPAALVGLSALAALLREAVAPAASSATAAKPLAAADRADLVDVSAAVGGDGEAYERIVRRYQGPISAYMWRFTRDRLQWEELVQDVFVEAYLSLPGYRAEAPLLHWLRRIATRVGFRLWRTRGKAAAQPTLPLAAWEAASDADARQADAREAAEVVHAVLARLAPRDRLVLTLMYLEECSVAEAARLCGWSQTMVKVQAHRARKRLKRMLDSEEILS